MKISATIITLNEQQNIGRCIDTLKKVVDEIIVLDSFSTDKTEEICRSSTANVVFVQRAWAGYAESKNYANSLANNEYILSMDADEVLSPELQQSILTAKQQGLQGVYQINRLTNYCGKWIRHSGWYPDIKARLFPKDKCYWQGAYVHETLTYTETMPTTLLQGDCYHYSYYSFADHRARADKYSLLTAQKFASQGKNASLLKPYVSALGRFISMYLLRLGFLDGWMGFKIAQISALSNVVKYKELRRLNHVKND